VELIARPKDYTVQIEFSEVTELSRPVMEVNNVSFRYSPKHPVIFERVDFGIDMHSRICVVGPNGAGKSVRLKFWEDMNSIILFSKDTVLTLIPAASLCIVSFPDSYRLCSNF
jgi:ATPase subunit of ABC transporter with duplicated ATPase domains